MQADDVDRVIVVAELSTNHFGDRSRLEHLIRGCREAGADYIKLQKRDVETFYSADQLAETYESPFGHTLRDYRVQVELDVDDFCFVDELCRRIGIGWFVSVLDRPSFHFMTQFDRPLMKLPSTISEHRAFLDYVGSNIGDQALVLSTGMTDAAYEAYVLDTFAGVKRLFLLQCTSAYPTPQADCNLAVVGRYRDLASEHPHIAPGYSSHDDGWMASVVAVGAGARMIEKHVKWGSTTWGHFDSVALDVRTGAFADYVSKIRIAERMMGSGAKNPTASEHHKYRLQRT